jgi:sigma-B regulation protein RsbU (phosphoserine phosphatase)
MRISLRTKLVVAVTVPSLLVCGAVIGVTTMRLRSRSTQRLEENATRIARVYAGRVGAELAGVALLTRGAGSYLARHPEMSQVEIQDLLRSCVAADEQLLTAAVFLPEQIAEKSGAGDGGMLVLALPQVDGESALGRWPQVAGRPAWVQQALESDAGTWVGGPRQDGPPSPARVIHAVAWRGLDGTLAGAVALELDIASIKDRLGALIVDVDLAITDREGNYLYHPAPDDMDTASLFRDAANRGRPDVAEMGRRMAAGESGIMRMAESGRAFWSVYAPIPGTNWSFSYARPETAIMAFSNSQLWLGASITLVGLFLIAGFIYVVARRSTAPLQRLVTAVDRMSRGDLGVRVDEVRSHDEIGDLARAFNRMVGDLRRYMETHTREMAAREAVESELRVARRIQTSLLPGRFPAYPDRPEFQLHAVNMPASQVAGDFFDFFLRDERTLVVVMADVSGKGIPAALFMAVARTVIRNLSVHCHGPAATLTQANKVLLEDNVGSMYVTLFLGWYDTVSGRLRYANAGHPRPYLVDGHGRARPAGEVTGAILGILPDQEYTDGEIHLEPGESLVLYTDGLSEARDPAGEFFGFDRLARLLESLAGEPVDRLCESVVQTIGRFQDREQKDDMTLLALLRTRAASSRVA